MSKKICTRCEFPNDAHNTYCDHCQLKLEKQKKRNPNEMKFIIGLLLASILFSIYIKLDIPYKQDYMNEDNKIKNYKNSVSEIIKIVRGMEKTDTVVITFPGNDITDDYGNVIGTNYKAPIKGYIKVKVDNSIEFKLYDGEVCGTKPFNDSSATLSYGECSNYDFD